MFDNFSWLRYMMRNFALASGRQVSPAPRGVQKDGGSRMSETEYLN
jgi:hypothetical protein